MSAIIFDLAEHKPKPKAAAPHFFCMKCNGDTFKAYSSGAMHCVGCGVLMRNIFVGVKVEIA